LQRIRTSYPADASFLTLEIELMAYLLSFRAWFTLALGICLVSIGCQEADEATADQPASPKVVSATDESAPGQLKVGYINSVELLSLLPEASSAEKSLQSYAAGQEGRFKKLAETYQKKVADAQQRGASMTPMEQRVAMREIGELEQQLQEIQAGSQERMARRREELLSPVLAKADSLVRAVASEYGYNVIYDAPALMYADSTLDVLPLVKQALGLMPKPEPKQAKADSAQKDSAQ
jgi:outer membrane protein